MLQAVFFVSYVIIEKTCLPNLSGDSVPIQEHVRSQTLENAAGCTLRSHSPSGSNMQNSETI